MNTNIFEDKAVFLTEYLDQSTVVRNTDLLE